MSIYDTEIVTLNGEKTTLRDYEGKALLIVNVASKCGLTPQYKQLEELQKKWADKNFSVLGFPCNQFLGQEPGSSEEIQTFCSLTYGVTFPILEKAEVNGENRHPLYKQLIAAQPEAIRPKDSKFLEHMTSKGLASGDRTDILWNFEKFLVGKDGEVVARFSPDMSPDDEVIVEAIEKAVAEEAAEANEE